MDKLSQPLQPTVFCGIDVSAKTLTVAVQQDGKALAEREFANTSCGHKTLIAWLQKRKTPELAGNNLLSNATLDARTVHSRKTHTAAIYLRCCR